MAQSEVAKLAGNDLFGKGDRAASIVKYSESLGHWPGNTAARCNRAFAYLKLTEAELRRVDLGVQAAAELDSGTRDLVETGRRLSAMNGGPSTTCEPRWASLVLAASDCSQVLASDPGYVKAWHRRGLAHAEFSKLIKAGKAAEALGERSLELLEQSLRDLRKARELDSRNAAVKKEVAAMERRVEAEKLALGVATKEAMAEPGSEKKKATPFSMALPDVSDESAPRVIEMPDDDGDSRTGTSAAPPAQPPSKNKPVNEVVARAAASPSRADAVSIVPEVKRELPARGPSTAYEFEAFWRSAKGASLEESAPFLFSYMKLLPAAGVAGLFARALSADLFTDIIKVCVLQARDTGASSEDSEYVKTLLTDLCGTARFDMNTMFFGYSEKEDLGELISALARASVLTSEESTELRKSYGI